MKLRQLVKQIGRERELPIPSLQFHKRGLAIDETSQTAKAKIYHGYRGYNLRSDQI